MNAKTKRSLDCTTMGVVYLRFFLLSQAKWAIFGHIGLQYQWLAHAKVLGQYDTSKVLGVERHLAEWKLTRGSTHATLTRT